MQTFYFFNFFKQQLCTFSQKLSNKNKQRLYKIQKCPTSLFYHALLIKQNECTGKSLSEALIFALINPQYDNRLFMQLP